MRRIIEVDEFLTVLDRIGDALLRAIHGIWFFLCKKVPELLRRLLAWLRKTCAYAYEVGVRVARIIGLFIAWSAIVFGPLVIYPGILTGVWAALAIAGSCWGLNRQIRRQRVTVTTGKGVWNG